MKCAVADATKEESGDLADTATSDRDQVDTVFLRDLLNDFGRTAPGNPVWGVQSCSFDGAFGCLDDVFGFFADALLLSFDRRSRRDHRDESHFHGRSGREALVDDVNIEVLHVALGAKHLFGECGGFRVVI